MIYQRNMENKKNCTLNENTNTSSLPVVFSEKLENKIQDVINYNKHNKDGISEWAKSLEYLSKYLSQRQIAFDYGGQHNYDRYEENETITITKIHYVTYKIMEDKNGRIYVEIVGAKLKPLDYGLEIPPSFTESKETSNQYISLRDYITEQKNINTIYIMKSLQEYILEQDNQYGIIDSSTFTNFNTHTQDIQNKLTKVLGVDITINMTFYKSENAIFIKSNNLVEHFGKLGKCAFKDIFVEAKMETFSKKSTDIGGSFKFIYQDVKKDVKEIDMLLTIRYDSEKDKLEWRQ